MKLLTIVFSLAAVILSGCASTDRISLVADHSQHSIVRDGVPALISAKTHVVMLRAGAAAIDSKSRPSFVIAVLNRSGKPQDLRVQNIKAEMIDPESRPIHIYSYEELVAEEETRQAVAAVGAALQGISSSMAAANAGHRQTYGTYSGSYGTYGTYSGTTYDHGAAMAAQRAAEAETSANFAAIQAHGERNLAALQSTILKDNTVLSGEWVGGYVVMGTPEKSGNDSVRYRINVHFGGEHHSFEITQSEMS